MQINDYTGKYIEHVLENDNPKAYESCRQNLFDHYFTYWAKRKYSLPELSANEIRASTNLIRSRLENIKLSFASSGVNLDNLEIMLFVGRNTSNGHAFRDNGRFLVWLPVETYHSTISIDIFVTHEIIHALHYQKQGEFYFDNAGQFNNSLRQLITEGIATCLTATVLGTDDRAALWADYLTDDQYDIWFSQCEERILELKKYFHQAVIHKKELSEFFCANNPDDIMQYRAGYFLGLKLVRSLAESKNITPMKLLDLDRTEFEKYAMRWLSE